MADLPTGFEAAMESIGMGGLITFTISQEMATSIYKAGMAEQAGKDELLVGGVANGSVARLIRRTFNDAEAGENG